MFSMWNVCRDANKLNIEIRSRSLSLSRALSLARSLSLALALSRSLSSGRHPNAAKMRVQGINPKP